MGSNTSIAWTDATFSPWWGCTQVSPGCTNCYAEALAKRWGHNVWGAGVQRRFFGPARWAEPRRWNLRAEKAGKRMKVFCGSMCDVFDNEVDQSVRRQLWDLIEETPYLDWQLLSKRVGNVMQMLPSHDWCAGRPNVWLGISVVNQEEADRDVPKLLGIPARIRFLSVEPQLGQINLWPFFYETPIRDRINWVINGGESGHHARPFEIGWARALRDQCKAAGVAFFMKQLGSHPIEEIDRIVVEGVETIRAIRGQLKNRAGADPSEWPEDLRVQEFPC